MKYCAGAFSPMFRLTRRLLGAWKPEEDALLRAGLEKHGPAWTLLSFSLPGRTPQECRKRQLTLSGQLKTDSRLKDPRAFHAVFHEGFELAADGGFVRVPSEEIGETPVARLAAGLDRSRTRRAGRPWEEGEKMVVREGYEIMGRNWKWIAARLHRRTPEEVQALMEEMSAEFNTA